MKPKTLFRLSLLFPYVLWGICALIVYSMSSITLKEDLFANAGNVWYVLLIPVMFYTFGVLFWFIPYTLLAAGLWIWSRHKSTTDLYKASIRSPFFLLILMVLEAVILSMGSGGISTTLKNILEESLLLGISSLVFGYICVGIAMGVYKILQFKNLIKEETKISIEPLPSEI